MNRIVKERYPAERLPDELREGLPAGARATVTIVEEAEAEQALPLEEILDTKVFIRAFESPEEKTSAIRELFEALRLDRKRAVASELTLAEVLASPIKGAARLLRRRDHLGRPPCLALFPSTFGARDLSRRLRSWRATPPI